jgi:hypothetical protein
VATVFIPVIGGLTVWTFPVADGGRAAPGENAREHGMNFQKSGSCGRLVDRAWRVCSFWQQNGNLLSH